MTIRVHMGLPTRDLPAATAFYTALLGAPPDKTRPGFARFAPDGVPIALSLTETDAALDTGDQHFGLRVSDAAALDAARARLEAAGLVEHVAESETCCWATQDKIWVSDPDGRAWETYRVLDDAPDRAKDPVVSCCGTEAQTGCCA